MPDKPVDSASCDPPKKTVYRLALWLAALLGVVVFCGGGWGLIQRARYASQVTSANCSLKQIGLGAHNFHDTYLYLPPLAGDGSDDPDVTVPVSFHTSILPYLELGSLYRSIDKTSSWDDPINKKHFSRVLSVCGSDLFGPEVGSDGYGLAHFVPNSQLVQNGRRMSLSEITDGSSNTVLTGSIGEAFPAWGDPENARDPSRGFGGGPDAFGGLEDGALIGLADGSVRFIHSSTSANVAAALATPTAGDELPQGY